MRVCLLPNFDSKSRGGVAEAVRQLRKALRGHGLTVTDDPDTADIVHGHGLVPAEYIGLLDVYTNHGVYPPDDPAFETNEAIYTHMAAARVITSVANWPIELYSDRVGVEPIVIHNGVDLAEIDRVPEGRFRRRYKIPEDYKLVLFGKLGTGNAVTLDGWWRAYEIALACRSVVFSFTTWLEGVEVPGNVQVTGPLSKAHVLQAIRDCDVFLSTCVENSPVMVLEAAAMGKPILALGAGGNLEAGVVTYTFDDGDLLTAAKGMRYCLADTGQDGAIRGIVERLYTWPDIARQYIKVYEQALAHKRAESVQPIEASIVITNYNLKKYIRATTQSALHQSFRGRYEVIVVDDCSTDDSLATIADLERHVKVIRLPKNGGPANARNKGVEAARGKYICCLDGDDLLQPNYLRELVPIIERDRSIGVISPAWQAYHEKTQRMSGRMQLAAPVSLDRLKDHNVLTCFSLFRRAAWERVGGYKDINPSYEDYEFWLSIASAGYRVWNHTGNPLATYTVRDSTGRNHQAHAENHGPRLKFTVRSLHPELYTPETSVVIPTYSHPQMMPDAVQSILYQTYQDFEIIVVDDGVGGLDELLTEKFPSEYGRRIHLVQQSNGGLSKARNAGIIASRGKYILPLDDDDRFGPDWLTVATGILRTLTENHYVYCDYIPWYGWDKLGELVVGPKVELIEFDCDELLRRAFLLASILYHKTAWERVGGYDETFTDGLEDWDFAIRLATEGICGQRIAAPHFYYRQHKEAHDSMRLSMKRDRMFEAKARVVANNRAAFRREISMGCNCGGRAKPNESITQMPADTVAAAAAARVDLEKPLADDSLVKMHYTGQAAAPVSIFRYQVSSKNHNVSAAVGDVSRLRATGLFEMGWV